MFHQILLHLFIRHRFHIQRHTPGQNRRQQCGRIHGKQNNNRIKRRLFYSFQQSILCLHSKLFRLRHNINFIFAAIWLYLNVIHQLLPDLIYADAIWFLMHYPYNIRVISALSLPAGSAFPTGILLFPFALQHLGKSRSQQLFSRTLFSIDNISMRNLI